MRTGRTKTCPDQRAGDAPEATHEREALVCRLLGEVGTLYERNTNPLLLTRPHRRRWGFVRALGATRLAHVLGAPRDAVVEARRLAFYRWRYWFFRYEATLWTEMATLGAHEWERNLLHYLGVSRGAPSTCARRVAPSARTNPQRRR